MITDRFVSVSEAPGVRVTPEALRMLTTRYAIAAEISRDRQALEVGCGAGMGLGWLARSATKVFGGDYSEGLLTDARRHYGANVPLARLDAHALPFRSCSFDVVILYEAIYYLAHAERFVQEAKRVLRSGGSLVICSANREWPAFNPSPFSTRYWSAAELEGLLADAGFDVRLGAAFPADRANAPVPLDRLKRAAVALGLMPRTMKGKALLKRLFFGRLVALPAELSEDATAASNVTPLTFNEHADRFKVVYAFGQVRANPH